MKKILIGVALAVALTGPAAADLVAVKTLSSDMVVTMLSAAVSCAKNEKLTVVIVNRDQSVVASFRGATATLNTVDLARRKAASAAQFGRPTGSPNAGPPPGPGAPPPPPATLDSIATQLRNMNTTVNNVANGESGLGGAQPIKVGDEVIGAIGLSGAGPMEGPCGLAAIAAIQSQLK